jgi:hypothetical protein
MMTQQKNFKDEWKISKSLKRKITVKNVVMKKIKIVGQRRLVVKD